MVVSFKKKIPFTYLGLMAYAALSLIAMATMSIGAAIVSICTIIDLGGPRQFWQEVQEVAKHKWVKRYLIATFFFILSCTISLISTKLYPLRFGTQGASVFWMKDLAKMAYFILPIVLLVGWRRLSETQQTHVIQSWLFCFGITSAVGVPQFFLGWPRPQINPTMPGHFHTTLFLGHHLSVASILIFPFFGALDIFSRRKDFGISKSTLLAILSLGLFTLIFSFSRTLWVALPLGIGAWILGKIPRKRALITLSVLCLFGLGVSQTSIVQDRMRNPMGISDRVELWKANIEFFKSRPIFGVGLLKNHELSAHYFRWLHPNQTDFFTGHAHNIYLEILAGLGIVGFIAWLFWIGWIFSALRAVIKSPPPRSFALGILCAWIVLLLNGITQVNFWEGKVLHQMMWATGLILFWASELPLVPVPKP